VSAVGEARPRVLAIATLVFAIGVVHAATAGASPTTERASVTSLGLQRSEPAFGASISGDGRRVAFMWVAFGQGGERYPTFNVFVRDRRTGKTSLVSRDSLGTPASGYDASMSPSGRFVAFDSGAYLAPAAGRPRSGVFYLYDLATGKTEAVAIQPRTAKEWVLAYTPVMAGDDRLIAYTVGRDPGNVGYHYEIAVRDRQTGADRRVSVARRGGLSNGDSGCPAISPNGRFVAYQSDASNLVANDSNRVEDVFVRDFREGRTALASVNSRGVPGNAGSGRPSVSGGGRVAFASSASNLVAHDTNGKVDVFVRDLATRSTRRVSVDSAGRQANDHSELPSISADGRYVTFLSLASKLVKGDSNGAPDVFVHDLKTGATRRVSVAAGGAQANGASYLYNGWNTAPSISRDGAYVAFQSWASNLVPGDTNDQLDVFVRGPLSP
jgi:hypothetical protein